MNSFGYESGDGIAHPPIYSGLDDDGNWDPPGSCPRGCGQPADECICKPIEIRPFKTLTETLRETEKAIARDLEGNSAEANEWERIRQWPGEK